MNQKIEEWSKKEISKIRKFINSDNFSKEEVYFKKGEFVNKRYFELGILNTISVITNDRDTLFETITLISYYEDMGFAIPKEEE